MHPAEAPETGAASDKHFVDYDEYVDLQIEKARAHIKASDIFTTATLLFAGAVAYLLLFAVCDQWLVEGGFAARTRLVMLLAALAAGATILVRRVVLPLIHQVHPLYAARMIERADPNFKSNLINFVDLKQSPVSASAAPVVLRSMEKRAAVQLSHIDVDEAIDRRPLLRTAYALLAAVVLSALYIVLSPKDPFASVKRALLPTADIEVATETTIAEVAPGDSSLPARSLLTIEADIRGRDADAAQILFTTVDHKYVDEPVAMRRIDPDLPRFRGTLNGENGRGLLQSLTYSIVAGDARTRDFRIDVVQPPSARADEVEYAYPHYMQLAQRTTPGGNIEAWEGTTVTLHATTNLPVSSALVSFSDAEDGPGSGEEVAMKVADGTKLTATWKLEFRKDGTFARFYRVRVKTAAGETDPAPTLFTLRIRPDLRPEVALLAPTTDLDKPANGIVPLVVQASDPDFGLRSLTLKAEKNGTELVNAPLFEDRELGQSFRGTYDLHLKPLRLKPGESIDYWIEARDNKQPTANRAATPRLKIEIRPEKSAEEVQRELAADKRDQQDQLAQADDARNAAGRERVDDPAARPDENAPPGAAEPRAPEKTPAGDKGEPREPEPNAEPAEASKAGETADGKTSPERAPDDPQKTLEKLVKQLEKEESAARQPPEAQDASEQPDGKSDPQAGDRGNKSENASQPDANQKSDRSGDKGTPSQNRDKPGETSDSNSATRPAGEKSDKSNEKAAGDRQNQHDGKPGSEKPAPENPGDKPPPQKSDGQRDDGQDGSAQKNDSDKNGSDKNDKPDGAAADKPADQPGGKTAGDDPMQKAGAKSDAAAPKSDADKNQRENTDPASSGGRDGQSQRGDDDSESGKPSPPGGSNPPEQPGDTQNGPQSPRDDSKKGKQADDLQGKEEPADGSADAQKRKASGDEQGPAEGADKPDPDAVRAKNDLEGKPGDKPGATQPSNEKGNKKKADQRAGDEGTRSRTDDARNTDRAPDGKEQTDQPGKTDDPASAAQKKKQRDEREKRPGQPPDAGNRDMKGEGRKTRQEAEQPETGEKGNSAATDQGKPGGNKSGAGDTSDQPGSDNDAVGKKTGQPGGKKGAGSKSQPSDGGKKSGEAGDKSSGGGKSSPEVSSDNESGSGEASDKQSQNPSGSKSSGGKPGTKSAPGSKGGDQPGQPGSAQGASSPTGSGISGPLSNDGSAQGNSSEAAEQGNRGGTSDGDGVSPDAEQARLDYARKATNLVLQKLKKQLERGEPDDELMKEMGWKDIHDVERFAKFLEDNLNSQADDNSPAAQARRLQFEELLRNLRIGSQPARRDGGHSVERRREAIGNRVLPIPPEYREQYEAYTKRLSTRGSAGNAKGAKDSGAK